MPSKKQKTDIRKFFKKTDNPDSSNSTTTKSTQPGGRTQPGGAAGTQPGGAASTQPGGAAGTQPGGAADSKTFARRDIKKENNGDSTDGHLHCFTVKFSPTDSDEYPVDCDQPRTVLEAIRSSYNEKMMKWSDENIVIQMGEKDHESIVATHFPCSCISDGESLIISCKSEKVEEAQHHQPIHSREEYSVFYIDTVGGLHTKQKKLFRSKAVKQFKKVCVYGEKGITVEEALKRDGRFIDDLGDFTLSDNDNPKSITKHTRKVVNLDQKEFKIRLPRNIRASDENQQENSGASNIPQGKRNTKPVLDVETAISVRKALEQSSSSHDTEEIYKILRQQFAGLKEWMESRFPGDSYQETLNLRKEEFGKIQQSFSEVHRVRKLLKLGESVCKVVVQNVCTGTGFVLFDNYVLTNAHLFKDCVEGEYLREGIDVCVLFNYEDPEPKTNYYYFQLARSYICYREDELDYAILELNPEGLKPNQTTQAKNIKVPPGLLKHFGPMPPNGEACIIGHPAGGVKQIDPTCIIEKERREQAVIEHIKQYKDSQFIVHLINTIQGQGIDKIMMGRNRAEQVSTYNTFMYHGSSGSPVFDAHGRVFGLHTAGFAYGLQNRTESVIELAQPVLDIFKHFVSQLKEMRKEDLLKRVENEANGNPYLKKVLKTANTDEPADPDENSDSDESMETDSALRVI